MTIEPSIQIEKGYQPGIIGRICELHAVYYHLNWGFGLFFEAKVATELAAFLQRYDETRDGIWSVAMDGRVEGGIVIDGLHAEEEGAHLRWFIVSDALRGKGCGKALIQRATAFCKEKKYRKIHLWTFKGLEAARRLYEQAGFQLIRQQKGAQWGTEVIEQYYEWQAPTNESASPN